MPGSGGRWAAQDHGSPLGPSRVTLSGTLRFVWSHRGRQTDTGRWEGRAWLPAASTLPLPPAALCRLLHGFYSVRKAKTRKEGGGWELTPHYGHSVSSPLPACTE